MRKALGLWLTLVGLTAAAISGIAAMPNPAASATPHDLLTAVPPRALAPATPPTPASDPTRPASSLPGAAPVSSAKEGSTGAPGTDLARTISQVTGVAISPLLGTGAVGAWRYFETPAGRRKHLPWFAQPWFWIPALLLVAAVAAKDILGPATPTTLKKPMDVMEAVENKISGLIAAGAFVPILVGLFGDMGGEAGLDVAGAGFAAATGSQLVNLLLTPFAVVAFVVVWLLGHVINVLILLSPFTTVDTVLKLLRTALLATIVGTSFVNPWVGAAWALAIILVAGILSGWSFRITLLGGVFLFDILSRRRRWFRPNPEANWMFLARSVDDAPVRSYGTMSRDAAGRLRFRYRPFLLGRRREVTLPSGEYCIGRGFIYADLLRTEAEDTRRLGILPPRYKHHEEVVSRALRLAPAREVGIRAVLTTLDELLFGRRSAPTTTSTAPPSPV